MRAAISRTLAAIAGLTAGATSAWAEDPTPQMKRLDLTVPDVPALIGLDLSADKISRPTTPLKFAVSLAQGLSLDGSFHDGVGVEVAPIALIGDSDSAAASALRLSVASAAIVGDDRTDGKAAVALRWDFHAYDPNHDRNLEDCLWNALPGNRPPPAVPPPVGFTAHADTAVLQACRDRARAAHLAQQAYELAVVVDGTSVGSMKLSDLATPHVAVWGALSAAYNSYKVNSKYIDTPRRPYGVQPTVMARLDLTDTGAAAMTKDLFVGFRLPFAWQSFGVFGEVGLTVGDLTDEVAGDSPKSGRIGGGLDYHVSNGGWLGVYLGDDFGDGAGGFSLLTNLKFSYGEDRQYGL